MTWLEMTMTDPLVLSCMVHSFSLATGSAQTRFLGRIVKTSWHIDTGLSTAMLFRGPLQRFQNRAFGKVEVALHLYCRLADKTLLHEPQNLVIHVHER